MNAPKPTLLQAMLIMMLTVGMTNHVFLIPALIQVAHRDSWLALIFSAPFVFLLVFVMMYISKAMSGQSIAAWVNIVGGSFSAYLFRVVVSLFCLTNVFFTIYETTIWTRINFLRNTPVIIPALSLMLICAVAARKGLYAIANISGVLLPITFVFGFAIAFINTQYKDYSQLLPLFEQGWTHTLTGSVYSMAGSFELLLILFLQPGLGSKLKLKPLLILAAIVIGFTMGPLIGALTEFNPYEARLVRFPAYEEWRLATVGKYLAQTDFLSIFQWLAGAFIRISLLLYVTVDMWNIKTERKRGALLLLLSAMFIMINMLPLSDIQIHQITVAWLFPANFLILTALAAGLTVIAYFAKRRVKNQHGNEAAGDT